MKTENFRAIFYFNADKHRNLFEYYTSYSVDAEHFTNDDYINCRQKLAEHVSNIVGNAKHEEDHITFVNVNHVTHMIGDWYANRVQFTGNRYNKAFLKSKSRYGWG